MKIAVDVMGTDYGPGEIIKGVLQAVDEYGCDVVLVGDQDVIRQELARENQAENPHVTIHHASQVIEMKDHPGISVTKKWDGSIAVVNQLLHEKECDALVSSGSTGAAVASALFGLGRIRGIERPAIATVIPNVKGATVLVDSGAKVDAKPEQLVQNAIMGSIYAELQLGIPQPRVGLLNIGEEETKGNEQCLATYPLLKQDPQIHFIGNVEGRDINKGTVDVVVCDGFVGNVVLKTMEGLATAVMEILKKTLMESGIFAKLGALLMKPALLRMKKQMDASEYGGALLMGVRAPFIICHGSSKAKAIKNAVRVAIELTQKDVVGRIRQEIMHDEESGEL
ncbi:phosphate acyltransferase PlsX [Acidaminococcus fermentans]|uniref:phosphate acyltransferase PlsX n=1 Tax=Acidaminococcus fermentans TaxID=905 RepID=UPI002431E670|nr:phosphate acyltransferase PlsX [Acidaminococcus fermentans]